MILLIDTSSAYCSVALVSSAGEIHEEINSENIHSHSEELPGMIQQVLGSTIPNAICISKGPGSYTGLRIGTSMAKGLCYGWNIPLLTANTLEAMAQFALSINPVSTKIVSMLDARRNEVYCLVMDNNKSIVEKTHALVLDENSFSNYSDLLFVGNANEKTKGLIQVKGKATYLDTFPKAVYMTTMAVEKYKLSQFEDLGNFEPFYLKEFIPGVSKKQA